MCLGFLQDKFIFFGSKVSWKETYVFEVIQTLYLCNSILLVLDYID